MFLLGVQSKPAKPYLFNQEKFRTQGMTEFHSSKQAGEMENAIQDPVQTRQMP